jgi:hypothetical protein
MWQHIVLIAQTATAFLTNGKAPCGVYCIKNTITNKVYIGSSLNIKSRLKTHIFSLKNNKHHSLKLQRSYNKYGKDNFISPNGNILIGKNLGSLCKEYNLDKAAMHRVLNGKQTNHKGWRVKNVE